MHALNMYNIVEMVTDHKLKKDCTSLLKDDIKSK